MICYFTTHFAGHCRGYLERYYFSAQSNQCISFIYGGCAGNGNNFASKTECLAVCTNYTSTGLSKNRKSGGIEYVTAFPRIRSDCSRPITKGPCAESFQTWGFDRLKGRCQNFTYSGCGGNANRFFSLMQCKHTCESAYTTRRPYRPWQRYYVSYMAKFTFLLHVVNF